MLVEDAHVSLLGQIRGESADPGGRAVVRPLHRAEPYMRTCEHANMRCSLSPCCSCRHASGGVTRAFRASVRSHQHAPVPEPPPAHTAQRVNFTFNFKFIRTVSTHTRARTAPLLTCVCVSVCCVSVFASLCLCTPTPRFSAPRFSAPRLPAPRLSPPRRLSPWAALGCTRLRSCAAPARPLGCTESPPPGLHSRAVTVFPAPWGVIDGAGPGAGPGPRPGRLGVRRGGGHLRRRRQLLGVVGAGLATAGA